LCLLQAAPVPAARAADLDKLDCSVKFVPADAAFYSAMLRNGEQIEAIAKSKAWAKIKALPLVQMLMTKVKEEWEDPNGKMAGLAQFYAQPENQELVEMLLDMFSNEMFCYAGENYIGVSGVIAQAMGAMQYGPAMAQLSGEEVAGDSTKVQVRMLLRSLTENAQQLKIPDLVIGFKLSDAKKAEAQLKRLEAVLTAVTAQSPQLKGRYKKTTVAKANLHTLTLDGKMVPWEMIPFNQFEDNPGEFDDLIKHLKQVKLTIALGIRENYLLLSLGESTAHLEKLGKGKHLVDLPDFKPLARFADRRLTSIGYASKALKAAAATNAGNLDSMAELLKTALDRAPIPDAKRKKIDKDLEKLADELKGQLPEVGSTLSFAFLTDRGSESYIYEGGDHPGLDGSKPLTLLDHVGGSPILAFVSRHTYKPENYQNFVKWVRVAGKDLEDALVPLLDPDKKETYEKFAKAAKPLLERLDKATGTLLLPALADGQFGFVLDGKLESKQWHEALPEADKPLPMLEPALVWGVSDAKLLKQAVGEYWAIAKDAIDAIRELAPDSIPEDFKLPDPQMQKVKGGTIYGFPLPEEWGLDKQILPNGGLSETVATLSISQKHAERLLAKTPLKVESGPLADAAKKPLASAVYVNWPALIDVATAWMDYAIPYAAAKLPGDAPVGKGSWVEVLQQVRTAVEVLKVFRGSTSCSYFEDGLLVTHSESIIKDL
jgi:hypothetical protein